MNTSRARNLERLRESGYRIAGWLPVLRTGIAGQLRPPVEIASRLMALDAVYTWVAFPEREVAGERIEEYLARNDLPAWMTADERELVALSRVEAYKRHVDTIGWKLEAMWPLAWSLGFETPPALVGEIPVGVTRAIVLDFMPGLDATAEDLLAMRAPRPLAEIVEMEDLFYCVHNAVRSAQLGEQTVPPGFRPIADGGAVEERRHALTWCLSPGTAWEATDLST